MRWFACCSAPAVNDRSDEEQQPHEFSVNPRKTLTTTLTNLSLRSDSSRKKVIASEIAKIGSAKSSTKVFTFKELASATDNFNPDCRIGEGGFGRVYKGYIKSLNKTVAIKQLDRQGRQGSKEFIVEVTMLSVVESEHLVNLIGYCAEGEQRVLVYEFMANGSLEKHLLDLPPDKEPLDWDTRMKIAHGAAKGLEYLHDVAKPQIIYRDFKAANVLLDENMNSKLSDFGLAKVGPTGAAEHVSTRVMGTYGYCAPEYALTGQLTTKSDVYSYGVVFMELITGRRVIEPLREPEERNMIAWAQPLIKEKKLFPLLVDPLLQGNYPEKGLHQALAIAAMCLQEDNQRRPSIGEVVDALHFLTKPKDR